MIFNAYFDGHFLSKTAFSACHWDFSRQIFVFFSSKFVIFRDFSLFFLRFFVRILISLESWIGKKGCKIALYIKFAMVDPGFIAVLLRFYCGLTALSPSWSRGFILTSKKKLNGFYKTGERFLQGSFNLGSTWEKLSLKTPDPLKF